MSERSGLERFSKHTPHRLRRLTLCCAGDMGVGVQGKACGEVTQHSGHGLHIYPVLQCQGGEGMAQVVEPHLRESRPLQHPVELMQDAVRGDGPAVG